MFAMTLRLNLFSLVVSNASPKLIRPCECAEGKFFAKFTPLLEVIHIIDWPFQLFDVESRCKIKCKLKELNSVSSDVYATPLVQPNLGSKKCMHVVDIGFVFDSQQNLK
jgi:hypothetical protein